MYHRFTPAVVIIAMLAGTGWAEAQADTRAAGGDGGGADGGRGDAVGNQVVGQGDRILFAADDEGDDGR